MSTDGTRRRVVLALLASIVATATGVAINLATEWKRNAFAWVAVGVATALAFLVSFWLRSAGRVDVASLTLVGEARWWGLLRARRSRYEAVGLHLELIEESASGQRVFTRAYTEESARMLIETRQRASERQEQAE